MGLERLFEIMVADRWDNRLYQQKEFISEEAARQFMLDLMDELGWEFGTVKEVKNDTN